MTRAHCIQTRQVDAAACTATEDSRRRDRRCSVGAVHFVIMGCGRVGASLARALERAGHEVAVIDQDEPAFRRLGTTFEGRRVTGVGFDRDTLREAGIEDAYAFAAVSSGDNSNILAARVARETFGVEHVVARIYDPGRAEVYQRLGIPTVATVRWTADQMLRRLLPQGHVPEFTDPSGRVVIAEMPCPRAGSGSGSPGSRRRPAVGSPTSPGSARACSPDRHGLSGRRHRAPRCAARRPRHRRAHPRRPAPGPLTPKGHPPCASSSPAPAASAARSPAS